jgi:hypothetical protein
MANISEFKAKLSNGGARANQFEVVVDFPFSSAGSATRFLCKAATLPASVLQDIPMLYRGREVHVAGERTFEPWTITIINETNFRIRSAFENWITFISANASTVGITAPSVYQRDMQVNQLDRNDEELMKYIFHDAYPTNVSEIQLSYDQGNQIEEFTVTFSYNYWIGVKPGSVVSEVLASAGQVGNVVGAVRGAIS